MEYRKTRGKNLTFDSKGNLATKPIGLRTWTYETNMGNEALKLNLNERTQIIEAVEQSQADQMALVDGWVIDLLSIDETDDLYHSFQSTTTAGLEIGSLFAGGY